MSKKHLKPIFWGLFSAGGTTAALALAPMILVICVLLPFGLLGNDFSSFYGHAHAWLNNWFIYCLFAILIFTFMWHGVHRLYYILHDMHFHVGNGVRYGLYTIAVTALVVCLAVGLFI